MSFAKGTVRGQEKLRSSVARDFSQGLNTYDSPLNLATRYSIKLQNLFPDSNGGLRLRYGSTLFNSQISVTQYIINMVYYNARIIAVLNDGTIISMTGGGNMMSLFSGWGATVHANFCPFEGKLVVCNGVDKPVFINEAFAVQYVADPATGSNVNVPRAKFCCTHNGYLVLAHAPDDYTTLYIGNKGVLGTFYGDTGVDNDAVNFNTSYHVQSGDPEITGLASFRDLLIVGSTQNILAVKLGSYNDSGEHLPAVVDSIPDIGVLNQRCMLPIGDTLFVLNNDGLTSLSKSTISGQLRDVRESTLLGTDLRTALMRFTPAEADQHVFMQYDSLLQHLMVFVPQSANPVNLADNDTFVLCMDRKLRFKAWTQYTNMRYRSACRTGEGRLFYSSGRYVFVAGNELEPVYTDPISLQTQPWDDGTLWSDGTPWLDEDASTSTGAFAIPFMWWLPWADMQEPGQVKHTRYISSLVEGTGDYAITMATDRFDEPLMVMTFNNTEQPTAPHNAVVRPGNNEQLYAWNMQFRRMSFRVQGQATAAIRFVAITLWYIVGGVKR
jgi:hypothetical protein